MTDLASNWRPIPLEARPLEARPAGDAPGIELDGRVENIGALAEARAGRPFAHDFCECCSVCCCCCSSSSSKECCDWPFCCACWCPVCTFGASLDESIRTDGVKYCQGSACRFCCVVFLLDGCTAGILSAVNLIPGVAGAAMWSGLAASAVSCLPGAWYTSYRRNEFRKRKKIEHNGTTWGWCCWPLASLCVCSSLCDTCTAGCDICWPCLAYQNLREATDGS